MEQLKNNFLISLVIVVIVLGVGVGFLVKGYADMYINNRKAQQELSLAVNEIEELQSIIEKKENVYSTGIQTAISYLVENDAAGLGGGDETVALYGDDILNIILSDVKSLNEIVSELPVFFKTRDDYFEGIPNIIPFETSEGLVITSGYAKRISPISGMLQEHKAIDFTGSNYAIVSTAYGRIRDHWINHPVYGRHIYVEHLDPNTREPNGYVTMYAHLSRSYIREGQIVEKGEVIARMGNSGLSDGIHLHYAVYKDGLAINPIKVLRDDLPAEYKFRP